MMKVNKLLVFLSIFFGLAIFGVIVFANLGSVPEESGNISIITPTQVRDVNSITAVDDLTDLVYSRSKDLYYVSSFDERKVYVVNPKNMQIEAEIPVNYAHRMYIYDEGGLLLVSGARKVMAISLNSFEIVKQVPVKVGAGEMDVDKEGKYLFVLNEFDNSVSVIEMESFNVVSEIQTGDRPKDLTVDRNGEFLYVANESGGTLSVISTQSLSLVKYVMNVGRPVSVKAFPDQDLILVLDQFHDMLLVIDQRTNEVVRKIKTVNYPTDMALNAEGNKIYVVSFTNNSIGVIDLQTERMEMEIELSSGFQRVNGLNNISFHSGENKIIVTNTNTGQVSFIEAPN